jgi:cation diffusion facilitator CzcD-associated flavoprotein CzcO
MGRESVTGATTNGSRAQHPAPAEAPGTDYTALPAEVEVAIVGAGFGGLGAAIELERAGFSDFAVLERGEEVGGTWWFNSYPGCQCDVPANLYSFSFASKWPWSRSYPLQPEIRDYLKDCSHRFGVRDRIHFDSEMEEARWDDAERRWRIETSHGSLRARVLVAAPGLLSEPKVPDLPGMDDFRGEIVHTARWGEGPDLAGKRVAVVGTGATAIQLVPEIQPEVERLVLLQRTPPWVAPLLDRPLTDVERRLYGGSRVAQRLARGTVYALRELYVLGMAIEPRLMKLVEVASRVQMRHQVRDPEMRWRLLPDYTIGCKRILLTNAWYPAITSSNVDVVFAGIEELRERSVVGADGSEHEVDLVVFATGFTPTDPPIAHKVRGGDGRTLHEAWEGSPRAYRGTTVAGFPNLFLMYGPNTNLGHTSIVYMLESQNQYLVRAMRTMREHGLATIEPRKDVQEAYNDDVQRRLQGTVWNDGRCASWYLDEDGDNAIMWSDFTFRFRHLAKDFKLEDHAVTANGASGPRRMKAQPPEATAPGSA